jgi:hypothetical protein
MLGLQLFDALAHGTRVQAQEPSYLCDALFFFLDGL